MTTATKIRNTPTSSLSRRLGAFEHLIWLTDQWSQRHFVLVARIEGRAISMERLEDAFRAVQRRHPALRTAIDGDSDGNPRFVPSESKIEICVVDRSSATQWEREVEIQLVRPFQPYKGPLLRATLVRGESVSELILASHHSIGDGVSALYLVRDP